MRHLGEPALSCTAQGVVGPSGRVFYVSPRAVYVWVADEDRLRGPDPQGPRRSVVYRLPLDGGAPGALRAWGAPTDQLSFEESADGHLNVLVRSESGGEGMWGAELAEGDVALLRVSLGAFDDGVTNARRSQYVALPRPEGASYAFHNRFVADHVLYGTGRGWSGAQPNAGKAVHVFAYRERGEATRVALEHGVDRVEALGASAMVIDGHAPIMHSGGRRQTSASLPFSRCDRRIRTAVTPTRTAPPPDAKGRAPRSRSRDGHGSRAVRRRRDRPPRPRCLSRGSLRSAGRPRQP